MRNKALATSVLVVFTLSGCASMSETQIGTAKGAGIGALGGAVIGAIAGGSKGAVIGAGVGAVGGAIVGNVWSQKMEAQKAAMEKATAGTGVAVTQTPDNQLKLSVPSDVSFDVSKHNVKPSFRPILDQFAQGLQKNSTTTVKIVGYTDNSGSPTINNPLSVNRAASVRDYLIAKGVPSDRISIDGRGASEPVAPNDTTANKAKNRRVEIFVAEPQQASATNG